MAAITEDFQYHLIGQLNRPIDHAAYKALMRLVIRSRDGIKCPVGKSVAQFQAEVVGDLDALLGAMHNEAWVEMVECLKGEPK